MADQKRSLLAGGHAPSYMPVDDDLYMRDNSTASGTGGGSSARRGVGSSSSINDDGDGAPVASSSSAAALASHSSASFASDTGKKKGCWAFIMKKVFKGNPTVALYALGLLIFSTGNSILFKKMTNKMTNYPYFLSQLTTFIYLPIFFGIVLYEMKFTNWITPSMTAFPKRKFLFMGMFDALSGIFMLFGGIHTSGSYQALLLNAVIPFTMAGSIIFLKTKYVKTQYAGATIIMAGVATVIVPTIVGGNTADNQVLFNIIFLLSTIPQAMSSIYKEIAFGDVELDVNYLQAWVALFQFLLGLLLAPLNSLPFLQDAYVPFKSIPETISNGGRCLAGINSVTLHNATNGGGVYYPSCWSNEATKMSLNKDHECDDCSGAWLPVMGYMMFNCGYNLFIVLVIKYGNAALLWIILTLRLPLVQIAFAIRAINDPPDAFKPTSIVGLFVIIAGLVLYRYSSVAKAVVEEPNADDDAAAGTEGDGEGEKTTEAAASAPWPPRETSMQQPLLPVSSDSEHV